MPTDVQELRKVSVKKAPRYCNVLYNNDKTTMDFVIVILEKVFHYTRDKAEKMTIEIHTSDRGVVHVSSKERCNYKNHLINQIKKVVGDTELVHTVEKYDEESE